MRAMLRGRTYCAGCAHRPHNPLVAERARDSYDWVTPSDIDKLLTAWEVPYRFPPVLRDRDSNADERPSQASVEGGPGWSLKEPQRYQGYARPLFLLLKATHAAGGARPKPRDVLEAFKANPSSEIIQVGHDHFTYYDSNGNSKLADLDAIKQAIHRMTGTPK